MNIRKQIFMFAFLISLMLILGSHDAFCMTKAGATIESSAVLNYENGSTSSEVVVITVDQMYGITIEPLGNNCNSVPGMTIYCPYTLKNVGNGTDNIRFRFIETTPESWTFSLIEDADHNGTYDAGTDTILTGPVLLSEEGVMDFLISVTIPIGEAQGTTGIARVAATGEGRDGGSYIGANGTIYGGEDTAEVTSIITVEALQNLMIHRDDMTGDIYLTWDGGPGDVYYIEGTFESTFAEQTTEAKNITSPFFTTLEAKDGRNRYYRVAMPNTNVFSSRTVGKFDIDTVKGFTFTSTPFISTDEATTHIDIVFGNQLIGASLPVDSDRLYSYQGTTWKQAYLKSGVGWTGTLQYFGPDLGAWIKILGTHDSGKLTYVGIVSSAPSREVQLNHGFTLAGSAYPVEVNINDSDLDAACTAGDLPRNADRIYSYENGTWKQAYLKTGAGWVGTLEKLKPGKAYWIKKNGIASVWRYPRPY